MFLCNVFSGNLAPSTFSMLDVHLNSPRLECNVSIHFNVSLVIRCGNNTEKTGSCSCTMFYYVDTLCELLYIL